MKALLTIFAIGIWVVLWVGVFAAAVYVYTALRLLLSDAPPTHDEANVVKLVITLIAIYATYRLTTLPSVREALNH